MTKQMWRMLYAALAVLGVSIVAWTFTTSGLMGFERFPFFFLGVIMTAFFGVRAITGQFK